MRLHLLLPFLLAPALSAQDGPQLYATYCAACHGTDGNGAPGANFPPLSASPWIAGPADRAVKVVLHGLEGPIEVGNKSFNLAMPPQGVVLPDDNIAAILTHVRTAFGNAETSVTVDQVRKIRAETAARDKPWSGPELLKLHPLPKEPSPLVNLISRTYFGDWKDLPDFSQLPSANVEEEHDGIIGLDQAVKQGDHFGMVWEGDFVAPEDGPYEFYFDADDGGRVLVDGKRLLQITGLGPMNGGRAKTGRIDLKKGPHPIRIEFYEVTHNEGIQLGWKGPGMKQFKWLSKDSAKSTKKWEEILLMPKDRPVIYRNFIEGTTARAIGVGFPGKMNLAWSADHLGPELLWSGNFIDAGRHWTDRGQGFQAPAGERLTRITIPARSEGAVFKGYTLDTAGNPTFRIRQGNRIITDSWSPAGDKSLRRVLEAGDGPPVEIFISDLQMKNLTWLTESPDITTRGSQSFATLQAGKPVKIVYTFKD